MASGPVPRTALGLVDDAVVVVRSRAALLVPLGLAGYGTAAAALVIAGAVGGGRGVALVAVPCAVLTLITAAAGAVASAPAWAGTVVTMEGAVRIAVRRVPALLVFTLFATFLAAAGLLGLLLLAVPVSAAMAVGFAALMLERCGPGTAVRRGLAVSVGNRGRVAVALLVAAGLVAVAAAIGAQAGWVVAVLGDGGTAATVLVAAMLVLVAAGFGMPVLVAVVVGAYVDCRIRQEALDLLIDLRDLPPVPR